MSNGTTFDATFSSFIDHYILLLAARFRAPLDVVLDDEGMETYGCTAAEARGRWELVSRCVQEELDRPRTAEERQNVKHLDVFFFTGDVCRERALYLQWKMQSCQRSTRGGLVSSTATAPGSQTAARPSTFDVTRSSLTDRVSAIFSDVRNSLPSALLAVDGDDADEEEEGEGEEAAAVLTSPTATNAVREVFALTAEEKRRDLVLARARDNLLSQVQALQAKFYEQHHRWVEVPYESLELKRSPATQPGATTTATASVAKRQSEELERAELLAALRGDGGGRSQAGLGGATQVSALERLKQTVHVDRPARPSEMSEDAIAAMYNGAAVPFAPAKDQAATASVTVSASITKETASPTGRHQRWQIMEYEEDPADTSDEDDE